MLSTGHSDPSEKLLSPPPSDPHQFTVSINNPIQFGSELEQKNAELSPHTIIVDPVNNSSDAIPNDLDQLIERKDEATPVEWRWVSCDSQVARFAPCTGELFRCWPVCGGAFTLLTCGLPCLIDSAFLTCGEVSVHRSAWPLLKIALFVGVGGVGFYYLSTVTASSLAQSLSGSTVNTPEWLVTAIKAGITTAGAGLGAYSSRFFCSFWYRQNPASSPDSAQDASLNDLPANTVQLSLLNDESKNGDLAEERVDAESGLGQRP